MKYSVRLQVLFWAFCISSLMSCTSHFTEAQARALAIDKLEKYCQNFRIERSLVKGPKYLGPSADGYAYQWVADLPNEGKTNIDIYVSQDADIVLTTEKTSDVGQ
ncbi:hypothetical protein [Thiobacillus sp.]